MGGALYVYLSPPSFFFLGGIFIVENGKEKGIFSRFPIKNGI